MYDFVSFCNIFEELLPCCWCGKLLQCNLLLLEFSFLMCCCSVAQSCPTLCDLMDYYTPDLLFLTFSWSLPKFMYIASSLMPSSHLILWHPLLLLSIFPSTRDFSDELAVHIRWPKYWSFSISSSNEYSGLISFKIDWFDLVSVQETLKSLP